MSKLVSTWTELLFIEMREELQQKLSLEAPPKALMHSFVSLGHTFDEVIQTSEVKPHIQNEVDKYAVLSSFTESPSVAFAMSLLPGFARG